MTYISFFPFPLMIGLLIIVLIGFLFRKCGRVYIAEMTLLGIYSLALLSAMFFPFRIPEGWPANMRWDEIVNTLTNSLNLIPFNFGKLFSYAALGSITHRMVFWQTAGNILITIPFGLGIGFLTRMRGWRIILISLGIGFTLEGLQLVFILLGIGNTHVIDINDLILNALGVLVGYGLFWAIRKGMFKAKIWSSELIIHR